MTKLIVFILVVLPSTASAADWICKEASSRQFGNEIRSCGIGISESENLARLRALDSAKEEFDHVCELSDECRDHKIVTEPLRTDCERFENAFKCYRLMSFQIGDKRTQREKEQASSDAAMYAVMHRDDPYRVFLGPCEPHCNSHDKSGCSGPGSTYGANHCQE